MRNKKAVTGIIMITGILLWGACEKKPSVTPTPTISATAVPVPSEAAEPTPTEIPKETEAPTVAPEETVTPKPTTEAISPAIDPVKTPAPTVTIAPTEAPAVSPEPADTATPEPSATMTPAPTGAMEPSLSPEPTISAEPTEAAEPTTAPVTPTTPPGELSVTPVPEQLPTAAPQPSAEPTPTETPKPTPTQVPQATPIPIDPNTLVNAGWQRQREITESYDIIFPDCFNASVLERSEQEIKLFYTSTKQEGIVFMVQYRIQETLDAAVLRVEETNGNRTTENFNEKRFSYERKDDIMTYRGIVQEHTFEASLVGESFGGEQMIGTIQIEFGYPTLKDAEYSTDWYQFYMVPIL